MNTIFKQQVTRSPFLLIAILFLVSCGSGTRVVQSWHDPAVTVVDGDYDKVLVIALIKDESTRRVAEDHMVKFMNGHGIPSYSYLGMDQDRINDAGMSRKMQNDNIDGVMIMRLANKQTQQTYVPGTTTMGYYGGAWGYYGYAYPIYSTPGYVQTDQIYYVETNLYSPKREGPVWTSQTSTVNPTDLGATVDEIMEAVFWRMKRDGFVVSKPKE